MSYQNADLQAQLATNATHAFLRSLTRRLETGCFSCGLRWRSSHGEPWARLEIKGLGTDVVCWSCREMLREARATADEKMASRRPHLTGGLR